MLNFIYLGHTSTDTNTDHSPVFSSRHAKVHSREALGKYSTLPDKPLIVSHKNVSYVT